MDISIVIPTYRRPALLARCLESLAAQSAPPSSYEVVVVDDGSGDSTPEVLRAAESAGGGRLIWESRPANQGPAAARNRGAERAQGRWVLFLDDDMVAPPGLVAEHLRWLDAGDDRLGVVGLVEWWPRLRVTPFMRWLDAGDVQFDFASMTEGPVEPPWKAFYTCNVSLGRRMLLDAGGFDERFPYPAYEDTELALRMSGRGFHLDYRPSALAWHARPITLGDFRLRMVKVGEAAMVLRRIQPELAAHVDIEGPRARGWRRPARRAALVAGPLLARTPLRERYYQQAVSQAFCAGVERVRGRPDQTVEDPSGSSGAPRGRRSR